MTGTRADDGPILRDRWWWRWALGDDDPVVPDWAVPEQSTSTSAPAPGPDVAAAAPTGVSRAWPTGATARLAAQRYGPVGGAGGEAGACPPDAWGHVVATTFGPVRRDPENPYNDHRAYASARCLFPVRAVERGAGRIGLVQPDAHATVDLGADPDGSHRWSLTLSGRYDVIPATYGWMRGSLVGLELGIVLRQLAVSASLHDLALEVSPPGPDDDALAGVPLDDPRSWSPAWTVSAAAHAGSRLTSGVGAVGGDGPRVVGRRDEPVGDRCLRDVADSLAAHPVTGPDAPLPAGVPLDLVAPEESITWAEVLWRRSSGRMPRGLHGFAFLPRRIAGSAFHDALAWLRHPPPAGLLREIHGATTVRVVLQDVDGVPDGLHRFDASDGAPDLGAGGAGGAVTAAAIEAVYGYPRSPGVGCGVGTATALWFVTVRPRELVERYGPAAWTGAQLTAGWITQGLCLSAAAHGLVARPMRAFPEAGVAGLLGLDSDEMLSIALCVGTDPPTGGLQLDLRT